MNRRLIREGDFDLLVGERVDKYDLLRELFVARGLDGVALSKNAVGGLVVNRNNAADSGEQGAIFVSVSDCGALAAAALSMAGPIGVDIQGGAVRPRVARKFFSERELSLDFNLVWARKEAYAKWLGTGLTNASLAVDTCDLDFYEFNLADEGFDGYYVALFRDNAAAEAEGAGVEDGGLAGSGARNRAFEK